MRPSNSAEPPGTCNGVSEMLCVSRTIAYRGFQRVLIAVGHLNDSFLRKMNLIYWELNSIAPSLDNSNRNKFTSLKKESPLETPVID